MRMKSKVYLQYGKKRSDALRAMLSEPLEEMRQVDSILIKPNLTGGESPDRGVTVHPKSIEVLISMLKDLGVRRIDIAEDSGRGLNTKEIFKKLGICRMAKRIGVGTLDFTDYQYDEINIPKGYLSKSIRVSSLPSRYEKFVSITTLKSHHQAGLSCALKNLFGTIPHNLKRKFHRSDIEKGIVDINQARKADFTVVDAFIGVEGMGPTLGNPLEFNLVFAGKDPVAVDTVASVLMERNPAEVRTINLASSVGLGIMSLSEIEIVGDKDLKKFTRRFKTPLDQMKQVLGDSIEIIPRGECSGCVGTAATALFLCNKRFKKQFEHAFGKLRLYVGGFDTKPLVDKRAIVVGDCKGNVEILPNNYAVLRGCPPTITDVMAAILEVEKKEKLTGIKDF